MKTMSLFDRGTAAAGLASEMQGGRVSGMFISVHIPKTAGTTFRELLADYFGDDLCLFYGGWQDRRLAAIAQPPASLRCVHGHFHARDFDRPFPEGQRLVWLRDPVERVCSEYEHHRRHRDRQNELSTLVAGGAGPIEFAEHPAARNTQARVLQGLSLDEFAFVGICERFDEELGRLAATTGIELASGHRANVNPHRQSCRYPLSLDLYRAVLELNREDDDLYRTALDAAKRDGVGSPPQRRTAEAVA